MGEALGIHVDPLRADPRVGSVLLDTTGLVVTLKDRAISIVPDRDHGRLVVWGWVRRLAAAETPAAVAAAEQFNRDHFARDGLALCISAEQNLLIVGRSLDGAEVATMQLLLTALAVRDGLEAAEAGFLAACATQGDSLPNGEVPFIRI